MKKILFLVALALGLTATAFADNYNTGKNARILYYPKSEKPASGTQQGIVILTTGLSRGDCGHGTTGNANVKTVCFSDGSNWIAV